MLKNSIDTIAAVATPIGCGGIGIIRISGEKAQLVAKTILKKIPQPSVAVYSNFYDPKGDIIDHGIALYFKKPYSFTGENILELQGHGGMAVLDLLLQNVLKIKGVRLAEPGEFSKRAFLNGKIDLVQAEAIADLINATSAQAARFAMKSLQGAFSNEIHALVDEVIQLRMFIESAIDFPEEEIDFLDHTEIGQRLDVIFNRLTETAQHAKQGVILKEGISIAIAGRPNVGKSSLLNQLTGQETAIVTEIPGTTRDVISEHIHIDGLPLHIIDMAGLRKTEDKIEKEGVKRAWKEIAKADRILLVSEVGETESKTILEEIDPQKIIIIKNKIDLTGDKPRIEKKEQPPATIIYLSAKTGAGMDLLRQVLKESSNFNEGEALFIARRRHLESLNKARKFLNSAKKQLEEKHFELFAEDLRQSQNTLSEITGEFTPQDLLDKIFSEFCVGK
ncbi:MAG: tRNA uridine-5-carboxymethylaminomethyl(34) synthesis GTPase MnmE [Gammaproteobacteria bacterium]|nr:tRNA uridine-5-carboxymethylaminomethyl(34) synthesis GTPase MnmE [Gammaproteobacteria bacterium]